MDVDARLEALTADNERLRDELEALKASMGLTFTTPVEWRLTATETKMFGRLLRSGAVTKDGFMALLYRDLAKDEAEIKIVDVFICKLRKKLKPFGLEIATIWGVGYQMPQSTKDRYEQEWRPKLAA